MWPKRRVRSGQAVAALDGSNQALDQIANWVRFADTKATVLTAGLGVAMTLLANNATIILNAARQSWASDLSVGGPAVLAITAFIWTLFWLIKAIAPQRKVSYLQPNRFSWPSLSRASKVDLKQHLDSSSATEDAWQQVLDSSKIAEQKLAACEKAVYGFGALIFFGFSSVTIAAMFIVR